MVEFYFTMTQARMKDCLKLMGRSWTYFTWRQCVARIL